MAWVSVLGEVDPSGNITARRKYDVYGAVRSVTGTPSSKHAFVGQLGHPSEDETGLTYMQARYYDPQIGRFASQDPKCHENNWYVYCSCDPINLADADGCAEWRIIQLLVKILRFDLKTILTMSASVLNDKLEQLKMSALKDLRKGK